MRTSIMQYRRRRDDHVDLRPLVERFVRVMEKVQTSLQNWAAEGSIPERVHRTWVVLKEHPFQVIGKVLAAIIIIAAVVAVLILG